SITIKVPQVSVLFNFQGPVTAAGVPDSSFIISNRVCFVKHFFDIFLSSFQRLAVFATAF
ncbi:MAG: hypothetical protein U0L91_02885, partial [Gemmiger sp.]|uniref:hypothetical protein n=1 Tax=Gemmiger sp. TaxID=2049027 RepID=UPI002E75BAC1